MIMGIIKFNLCCNHALAFMRHLLTRFAQLNNMEVTVSECQGAMLEGVLSLTAGHMATGCNLRSSTCCSLCPKDS